MDTPLRDTRLYRVDYESGRVDVFVFRVAGDDRNDVKCGENSKKISEQIVENCVLATAISGADTEKEISCVSNT